LIDFHKQTPARAFAFLEGPLDQPFQQFADRTVQFLEREELAMAQRGHDPTLGNLNADFDFGFVAGFARPCRQHTDAIVRRHLLVSRVQIGLVAARLTHSCFRVVGYHQLRTTSQKLKGADVGPDPRGQLPVSGS